MDCPAGRCVRVGMRFKLGDVSPATAAGSLARPARRDAAWRQPANRSGSTGSAWEYPTFENVDSFAARLIRRRDRTRPRGRCDAAPRIRELLPQIEPASFCSRDRDRPRGVPHDRARAICDRSSARRRGYSGRRPHSRLFRSVSPHTGPQASDRTDTRGDREANEAVVVFIQDDARSVSSMMRELCWRETVRCDS